MAQHGASDREQRNGEHSTQQAQYEETGRATEEKPTEATESYFDGRPSTADSPRGTEGGVTQEAEPAPTATPQPARTSTGNLQRNGSSRFARFSGYRRTTSEAQADTKPHDPYPLSSDSETTSSSDDEKPAKGGRRKEGGKAQQRRRKSRTAAKDEDEEKQQKSYSRFSFGNNLMNSKGRVSKKDGRLKITMSQTAHNGYVTKALGQSIRNHLNVPHKNQQHRRHSKINEEQGNDSDHAISVDSTLPINIPRPRLNIVIMVIGSRGDIQPFLQVGKVLKHEYGHRVRIASHPTFKDFVETDAGLEFFSVGGDPAELMAFMVKNPGLIPNFQTVKQGEVQRRRNQMATMFDGFWRACVYATDDPKDRDNTKMNGDKAPFIADAIIANPPSMAHVHIAEKLGVPLHVMFTFPYTPTTAFPHPLANINPSKNKADPGYVNFMSYPLVEMMTWQGLGDIVNKFRENTLDLEPVSSLWAPGALYRMKVPYTYLWSPSLVNKPEDWGPEIDIAGFVFLDLASDFKPPKDLEDFLNAGEPPVYIGFGSIVVDDPDKFTDLIFEAARLAGVRVLVNKGWGGLGQDNSKVPENVFMLGNTPHDWLFPRVKAVVHHGGAGTTAIGLKLGNPTMIIPFFGDQPFWGSKVAEAKAGAHESVRYKSLTAEKLAEGIKECLTEEAQRNAQTIADSIAKEGDGASNAVKSFHRSLPLTGHGSMRCSILQDRVAVRSVKHSSLRLSSLAAEVLQRQGKMQWDQLRLLRHYEWNDFDGPGGPFTGGAGALSASLYEFGAGFGMVPMRVAKHFHQHQEAERKKRERRERREQRRQKKADQLAVRTQVGEAADGDGDGDGQTDRPANNRHATTATTATTATGASTLSAQEPLPQQFLEDFGSGVKRSGAALLTLPNDLTLSIAQGFHNAPRLYGDATVRKPVRITGIKSGLVAARKEFQYGAADAWTGLYTRPKGDWQDGDTLPAKFAGLGTGIGKGLGGFVLKGVSSIISPPAFVGQGIIKSVESWSHGPGAKEHIRRAHVIQGQNGFRALNLQDPEGEKGLIRDMENRVMHGWEVYEQLWAEVRAINSGPTGKLRVRQEKRHWDEIGALDNVDAAERALEAYREGKDIDKVLAKHRRELKEAEKPKRSAMADTEAAEKGEEEGEDSKADQVSPAKTRENDREDELTAKAHGEDSSESTAVATPEEGEQSKNMGAKASDRANALDFHAPAATAVH